MPPESKVMALPTKTTVGSVAGFHPLATVLQHDELTFLVAAAGNTQKGPRTQFCHFRLTQHLHLQADLLSLPRPGVPARGVR